MINNTIKKLINRLKSIGIDVQFAANYPWVYLRTVNGKTVTELYQANHGFTAFTLSQDGQYKWVNRAKLFKKIREMSNMDAYIEQKSIVDLLESVRMDIDDVIDDIPTGLTYDETRDRVREAVLEYMKNV